MATQTEIERRAIKISNAAHPRPEKATARDVAYVNAYFKRFGTSKISLGLLIDDEFPNEIAKDYSLKSYRFDDVAVLGVRLPSLNLLDCGTDFKSFRLTKRGIALAMIVNNSNVISGAEAL